MERPDLSQVDPQVKAYIEYLEKRLKINTVSRDESSAAVAVPDTPLPAEAPTTINIVTISKNGFAKRTLRHLYPRQHRGGMGIFDIDISDEDAPAVLLNAEEGQSILVFTNKARVYRLSLSKIETGPVHMKGQPLFDRSPLDPDETVAAALPDRAAGYIALLSAHGRVRCLRHHLFGEHMRPGTAMFRYEEFGPLVSVCWTPGDSDLFIASKNGQAIRFSEKLLNPQGDLGLRLADGDQAVSVTSVYPDSNVFLLSANGKGTIRSMNGFAPNKSTGGSGKIAMKTDQLIGAVTVEPEDEIFAESRYGKVIRFRADEVPDAEGAVQGVYCMGLRGDEVSSVMKSSPALRTSGLY
jgi:DNA gyrase subunit A